MTSNKVFEHGIFSFTNKFIFSFFFFGWINSKGLKGNTQFDISIYYMNKNGIVRVHVFVLIF